MNEKKAFVCGIIVAIGILLIVAMTISTINKQSAKIKSQAENSTILSIAQGQSIEGIILLYDFDKEQTITCPIGNIYTKQLTNGKYYLACGGNGQ